MKIYFGGSIRGGRGDQEIYLEIINILKNYGEVLTEHIGDKSVTDMGQIYRTDEEIFNKDVSWVHDCDVMVSEVTNPSLGVGYELGLAESLNKKIIALYRPSEDRKLSSMIRGNKNITCIDYKDISELSIIFDRILK
ncbi:MAG: nucleoside 2-deoxyribosyltransferase [Candidatus Pacebacteria bacterium]|nr:nucleoside 2-deoxyribosyltransferase [Candidatus Paceibacterota bacterium]